VLGGSEEFVGDEERKDRRASHVLAFCLSSYSTCLAAFSVNDDPLAAILDNVRVAPSVVGRETGAAFGASF